MTNNSGGEKARAALGVFMLRPYNCLMLDEASNHLDRPSAMALAKCLSQFTGTCPYTLDTGLVLMLEFWPGFSKSNVDVVFAISLYRCNGCYFPRY